jgi:hypothetical protein
VDKLTPRCCAATLRDTTSISLTRRAAVRYADRRLTVRPMVTTEPVDRLAAVGKYASHIH